MGTELSQINVMIDEMRAAGVPIAYIAGSLGVSRREVEDHLSHRTYGESLSARIEGKVDLLLDAVNQDSIGDAKLSEITSSIKVLNEIKRLEEGKSTENIDVHVSVREAIREQVKRHRESVTTNNG